MTEQNQISMDNADTPEDMENIVCFGAELTITIKSSDTEVSTRTIRIEPTFYDYDLLCEHIDTIIMENTSLVQGTKQYCSAVQPFAERVPHVKSDEVH